MHEGGSAKEAGSQRAQAAELLRIQGPDVPCGQGFYDHPGVETTGKTKGAFTVRLPVCPRTSSLLTSA